MDSTRRLLTWLLTLLLTLMLSSTAQAMSGSAATAVDMDLLVIGALDDYPIFYANQDGEASGLAVDLLDQFAKDHGYMLTYELYPSAQIDSVFKEKGDLKFNISRLDETSPVQSTLPFYYKNYALFAHTGSTTSASSYNELRQKLEKVKDKAVIGYKGSPADRAYFKKKLNVLSYKKFESSSKLLSALDNHAIAYALVPDALAEKMRREMGLGSLRQISSTLFIEESSFILAPQHVALLYDLNQYIKEIRMDERLNKLISKWFIQPPSPSSFSPYILYFNLFALFSILIVLLLSYKNSVMKRIIEAKTGELIQQNAVNQRLYAELLQKEKYKNTYFMNMSHELRTPISVILNAVQMIDISSKNTTHAKIEKYSQIIQDNSYRLLRVISNLIDVHRLEARDFKLRLESVAIEQLIQQVNQVLIEMGYLDENSMTIDSAQAETYVYADRYELSRIFVNLISNTVKFNDSEAQINLRLASEADQAVIYYSDNSSGITPEMRATLFSGFYFETALPMKKSEGRGLGLYLVREMMSLHGGSIELCDGSHSFTYKLTLPIPPADQIHQDYLHPAIDLRQLIRMEFAEVSPHQTLKKASSAD